MSCFQKSNEVYLNAVNFDKVYLNVTSTQFQRNNCTNSYLIEFVSYRIRILSNSYNCYVEIACLLRWGKLCQSLFRWSELYCLFESNSCFSSSSKC